MVLRDVWWFQRPVLVFVLVPSGLCSWLPRGDKVILLWNPVIVVLCGESVEVVEARKGERKMVTLIKSSETFFMSSIAKEGSFKPSVIPCIVTTILFNSSNLSGLISPVFAHSSRIISVFSFAVLI